MNTEYFNLCCQWYKKYHLLSSITTDEDVYKSIIIKNNSKLIIPKDISDVDLNNYIISWIVSFGQDLDILNMYIKFIKHYLPIENCYILKINGIHYSFIDAEFYHPSQFKILDIKLNDIISIPDCLSPIKFLDKYQWVHSWTYYEVFELCEIGIVISSIVTFLLFCCIIYLIILTIPIMILLVLIVNCIISVFGILYYSIKYKVYYEIKCKYDH